MSFLSKLFGGKVYTVYQSRQGGRRILMTLRARTDEEAVRTAVSELAKYADDPEVKLSKYLFIVSGDVEKKIDNPYFDPDLYRDKRSRRVKEAGGDINEVVGLYLGNLVDVVVNAIPNFVSPILSSLSGMAVTLINKVIDGVADGIAKSISSRIGGHDGDMSLYSLASLANLVNGIVELAKNRKIVGEMVQEVVKMGEKKNDGEAQ